ncbi:MAG: nucleotide exchange factor GrpE [Longimicrobiales bacterium]
MSVDGRNQVDELADAAPDVASEATPEEEERVADEETIELATLQSEIEALNERHLRLAAEFDNYRKRVGRERSELRRHSQAELVSRLLETVDDLQRVLDVSADDATASSLLEGVRLVQKKLVQTLESTGLEEVPAEPGTMFDPTSMEAVMRVAADNPEQDDTVSEVLQKGYRFDGILVRPAKVGVRKHD